MQFWILHLTDDRQPTKNRCLWLTCKSVILSLWVSLCQHLFSLICRIYLNVKELNLTFTVFTCAVFQSRRRFVFIHSFVFCPCKNVQKRNKNKCHLFHIPQMSTWAAPGCLVKLLSKTLSIRSIYQYGEILIFKCSSTHYLCLCFQHTHENSSHWSISSHGNKVMVLDKSVIFWLKSLNNWKSLSLKCGQDLTKSLLEVTFIKSGCFIDQR